MPPLLPFQGLPKAEHARRTSAKQDEFVKPLDFNKITKNLDKHSRRRCKWRSDASPRLARQRPMSFGISEMSGFIALHVSQNCGKSFVFNRRIVSNTFDSAGSEPTTNKPIVRMELEQNSALKFEKLEGVEPTESNRLVINSMLAHQAPSGSNSPWPFQSFGAEDSAGSTHNNIRMYAYNRMPSAQEPFGNRQDHHAGRIAPIHPRGRQA